MSFWERLLLERAVNPGLKGVIALIFLGVYERFQNFGQNNKYSIPQYPPDILQTTYEQVGLTEELCRKKSIPDVLQKRTRIMGKVYESYSGKGGSAFGAYYSTLLEVKALTGLGDKENGRGPLGDSFVQATKAFVDYFEEHADGVFPLQDPGALALEKILDSEITILKALHADKIVDDQEP